MKGFSKNSLLLTFLFGFAIALHAGEEATPSIIPSQTPGLEGSITGLYLQPNANNLEYAVYTVPLPLPAPNWYPKLVNPDYDGAFAVGLHYNLADKTDQMNIDWLHFNSSDSGSFTPTEPNTSVGPPYYFGPNQQFQQNTSANSQVKFNVDYVGLVFGHFINLTDKIKIRPYFGISAAYLKEDITNNYYGRDPILGNYSHRVNIDYSFTGFGPRLGLDTGYFLNNYFGIDGGMACSLLVGNLGASTEFTSWTALVTGTVQTNSTPATTALSNQSRPYFVPEIEGKVGLFYTSTWYSNSTLTIQVGYIFQDYINAIYQALPTSVVPGAWEAGTVAIISHIYTQSDLSLNGPYVSLVLK